MDPAVLSGRRRVHPALSRPCCVPDHELSFQLMGLPFAEPGFATIVRRSAAAPAAGGAGTGDGGGEDAAPPCVHGVLHDISAEEWVSIKRSEGVGSSSFGYQVVSVGCRLYDGTRAEALTLMGAAASMHAGRRVLPSLRYLRLLREGAAHHGVDPAYRAWLQGLEGYERSSPLGVAASLATFAAAGALAAPAGLAVAAAAARGSAGGGGSTVLQEGAMRALHNASCAVWWMHDAALAPLLGRSGCRNSAAQGSAK